MDLRKYIHCLTLLFKINCFYASQSMVMSHSLSHVTGLIIFSCFIFINIVAFTTFYFQVYLKVDYTSTFGNILILPSVFILISLQIIITRFIIITTNKH